MYLAVLLLTVWIPVPTESFRKCNPIDENSLKLNIKLKEIQFLKYAESAIGPC